MKSENYQKALGKFNEAASFAGNTLKPHEYKELLTEVRSEVDALLNDTSTIAEDNRRPDESNTTEEFADGD